MFQSVSMSAPAGSVQPVSISRSDYNRWQATAYRILGELIAEGRDNNLPPLTWTLAITGALAGQVPSLTAEEREQQRATLTAWAAHLGAAVTETVREDGRISLHAAFSRQGERVGALRAEIWPERDGAGEAQQQTEGVTLDEALNLADGPARCPLCPHPVTLHTPSGARAHFTTVHPSQRFSGRGPGPWPRLAPTETDDAGRER